MANITTAFVASEAVNVALGVFVTLTVILSAFIVLLFANKKFRACFFDSDSDGKKKKRAAKKPRERVEADAQAEKPLNTTERTAASSYRRRKSAYSDDGVPTVPLGGIGMSAATGARDSGTHYPSTYDKIPTVVLGAAPQHTEKTQERTYITSDAPARKTTAAASVARTTPAPKTTTATATKTATTAAKSTTAAKTTTTTAKTTATTAKSTAATAKTTTAAKTATASKTAAAAKKSGGKAEKK